jgi:hypothetical protein
MKDLASAGYYVAGFTNKACASLKHMYDLFIDLPAGTITVAEHAASDFLLGGFHRQLGETMVKSCANTNEQGMIKLLALKTNGLIKNLKSLCTAHDDGGTYVTLAELQQKQLPPNYDLFLHRVAIAEGLGEKKSWPPCPRLYMRYHNTTHQLTLL